MFCIMKKTELTRLFANLNDISLSDAGRILDALSELIVAVGASGESFNLPGVLRIDIAMSKPRRAYDFKSGEVGYTESKPMARVKIGARLREAIQNAPVKTLKTK